MKQKHLLYFLVLLLCTSMWQHSALAGAGSPPEIVLKPGEKQALIAGRVVQLPVAPVIEKEITLVPLRFIAECLKTEVNWDEATKKIAIIAPGKEIQLEVGKNEAMVNGAPQLLVSPPVIIEDFCLAPLRFISEFLGAKVAYLPQTKEIHITLPPPPNQPPAARFKFAKTPVDQGETVEYLDASSDPDGDKIINWQWTGKKRAFFKPGEYTVSLRVQDGHKVWSEPIEATITVTDKVLMDEITYNFTNPIPGEPLDIAHIPVTSLRVIDPVITMGSEKVLLSNSPETFTEDGILYTDTVMGSARIHYHHQNGTTVNKYVYLLATNKGSKPAEIIITKQGTGGPSDAMSVGRMAVYRFLASGSSTPVAILPEETRILYATRPVFPGQCIDGLFDVKTNNDVLFSVVVTENLDPVTQYEQLKLLPLDGNHSRGTFPASNRFISVNLDQPETSRLIIADGKNDFFLSGMDERTKRIANNTGNYGVLYELTIESKYKTGIVLSARGGPFVGAIKWDNQVFYLPNSGILNSPDKGALIGVLLPGQQKTLYFIPPSGSCLPINLVFIPFGA